MNIYENFYLVFLCISQLKNFVFGFSNTIFWILSFFEYRRFVITSNDTTLLIAKNIRNKYKTICNKFNENKEPIGMCFHFSFTPQFMYNFNLYEDSYIFCKKSFFDEITKTIYDRVDLKLDDNFIPEINSNNDSDNKINVNRNSNVKYIIKKGSYGCFRYTCRGINISSSNQNSDELQFFSYQDNLFKDIMNFYKDNNFCKVFLSGEPGCGKTFFSYIMAQKLGCYLCDSFNPYEPSSNFNEIYSYVETTPSCPVIILIDEVDILINKIHNKDVIEHKYYTREIFDKTSYTSFMDKIEYGLFPNVILIMNSNKKKKDIDNLDKAYMRTGRINIISEW